MKNAALTGAWFLDSLDTEVKGSATFEWLGGAFVAMRSELGVDPAWDFVFGHSDAQDAYTALYHDERGVARVFAMTFSPAGWTLTREDPTSTSASWPGGRATASS